MGDRIFISFASEDRKVATTICAALEGRGFKCWMANRDIAPGDNFQVAIVRAIRQSKMMLLVFTANSNGSEEMTKELALASQQKLMVVPLRVEDVAPNDAFAYEFATRQWIDFFADWEDAINQLCERIAAAMPSDLVPKAVAARSPSPSAPLTEAPPVAPPLAVAEQPPAPVPSPAAPIEDARLADPVVLKATTRRPIEPPTEKRTFAVVIPPQEAEQPETAEVEDKAPPSRLRVAMWSGVAALVVLGVAAGLAAPKMMKSAPEPQAQTAANTAPLPAPEAAAPILASMVVVPAAEAAAPAAPSAAAAPEVKAPEPAASDAPAKPRRPRVQRVAEAPRARADLPY